MFGGFVKRLRFTTLIVYINCKLRKRFFGMHLRLVLSSSEKRVIQSYLGLGILTSCLRQERG